MGGWAVKGEEKQNQKDTVLTIGSAFGRTSSMPDPNAQPMIF